MSHVILKSGCSALVERLNRFPQGAPPSETLYKILEILLSEREAELVAQLPIKPFTARRLSQSVIRAYSVTPDAIKRVTVLTSKEEIG